MHKETFDKLLESVKKHEGYKNTVYLDTLNKRTVGVGHLCVEDFWEDGKEYEEKFLMDILQKDLQGAIDGAEDLINNCPSGGKANISDDAKIIIIEMIFQLGKTGVSKFRNMWKALQQDPPNYEEAAVQMLDSRWAKQTPNRAKEMAGHMAECVV
jgi:lysozyme